jgi:hypothetical protein
MESALLLVRVWRLDSVDGRDEFRASVRPVGSEFAALFTSAVELAGYLDQASRGHSGMAAHGTPAADS